MHLPASRRRWTREAILIAFCGFNSALAYLFIFLLPFQLSQHYARVQPFLYDFQNASPALLAVGWVILFQLYYAAYRLCPKEPSRVVLTILFSFPVFCSIILFFMYPFGANDVYEYFFRAHMFVHYEVSPMAVPPEAFPDDPLLQYVWWKWVPSAYGPFWELIAALTTWLAGIDLWANVVAYKLVATLHFLAGIPVVYYAIRAWKPAYAARGLLLYAWNPLILFEFVGNAHNDAVAVFWMLVAVALLLANRHIPALVALSLAILTKYVPALLLPFFLIALWKSRAGQPLARRLLTMAAGVGAMATLAWLLNLPFGIQNSLGALNTFSRMIHQSLPWGLLHLLESNGIASGDAAIDLVRNISSLVIVLVALVGALRMWRGANTPQGARGWLLVAGFEILFAYLLLAALRVYPWYLTWLFALVPFLAARFGYVERAVLFCFTSLGSYFVWFYRWPVGSPVAEEAEIMMFWWIFPLPLLFTLFVWLYQNWTYLRPGARASGRRRDQPAAQPPPQPAPPGGDG